MRLRSSKLRRWLQLRRQLVGGFPRVPTTSPLHQEGVAAALPPTPQLSPDSLPEVTQWVGSSPLHHQPHLVDLPGGFTQGIKRRPVTYLRTFTFICKRLTWSLAKKTILYTRLRIRAKRTKKCHIWCIFTQFSNFFKKIILNLQNFRVFE